MAREGAVSGVGGNVLLGSFENGFVIVVVTSRCSYTDRGSAWLIEVSGVNGKTIAGRIGVCGTAIPCSVGWAAEASGASFAHSLTGDSGRQIKASGSVDVFLVIGDVGSGVRASRGVLGRSSVEDRW